MCTVSVLMHHTDIKKETSTEKCSQIPYVESSEDGQKFQIDKQIHDHRLQECQFYFY